MVLALLAALLLLGPGATARAAESGVYIDIKETEAEDAPVVERWRLYGASYALVIGNDTYTNGWPRLSNAIRDARLVAEALEARGFRVELLTDTTAEQLREHLRRFLALTGSDPEARLFVWFAGHGHSDSGEGYLVPVDAPPPQDPEFLVKALHMGDVGSMMRLARAKHVMAVFDSCFAGTVFSTQRSRPPAAITRAAVRPVRQFLTSGDADQKVSDDGTFRELFLRALRGEEAADANRDGYLTGTELSLHLESRITNLTQAAQTPRSGKLRDPRFDRGDFVFLLPRQASLSARPDAETTAAPVAPSNEALFWSSIKDSDDPRDYEDYLGRFPQGTFAALARRRMATLSSERQVALTPPKIPQPQASPETTALARVLAAHAVAARHELKTLADQERLYWWYVLHQKGGADLLQRSVLLAVESLRAAPSEAGEQALDDGLSLLTCPRLRLRHGDDVNAIAFDPEGRRLASASNDTTARIWDLEDGQEAARLVHGDAVRAIAFSPNGELVATGSHDGTARLWEAESGREVARLAHDGWVTSVAFSPDGTLLASGSADATAATWDVASGRQAARMQHPGRIRAIAFTPDGKRLATLSGQIGALPNSTTARLWDVAGGRELMAFAHERTVESLAIGPDGQRLATASWDGARVWDLSSGRTVVQVIPKRSYSVIAFSPDGRHLAAGRYRVRLWDAATGRDVAISRGGHSDNLRTLVFSPNGRYLASGGQDATARIWEADSGREVARLAFPTAVDAVAFSPDGRTLATAGGSESVDLWDVRPGDPVSAACACLTRDLTPEEWDRYLGEVPYRPTCPAAARR